MGMSRPSPNILLAYEPAEADHLEQVVSAPGIWAVLYRGDPINIRCKPRPNIIGSMRPACTASQVTPMPWRDG
jgi:hypothetical protein